MTRPIRNNDLAVVLGWTPLSQKPIKKTGWGIQLPKFSTKKHLAPTQQTFASYPTKRKSGLLTQMPSVVALFIFWSRVLFSCLVRNIFTSSGPLQVQIPKFFEGTITRAILKKFIFDELLLNRLMAQSHIRRLVGTKYIKTWIFKWPLDCINSDFLRHLQIFHHEQKYKKIKH